MRGKQNFVQQVLNEAKGMNLAQLQRARNIARIALTRAHTVDMEDMLGMKPEEYNPQVRIMDIVKGEREKLESSHPYDVWGHGQHAVNISGKKLEAAGKDIGVYRQSNESEQDYKQRVLMREYHLLRDAIMHRKQRFREAGVSMSEQLNLTYRTEKQVVRSYSGDVERSNKSLAEGIARMRKVLGKAENYLIYARENQRIGIYEAVITSKKYAQQTGRGEIITNTTEYWQFFRSMQYAYETLNLKYMEDEINDAWAAVVKNNIDWRDLLGIKSYSDISRDKKADGTYTAVSEKRALDILDAMRAMGDMYVMTPEAQRSMHDMLVKAMQQRVNQG